MPRFTLPNPDHRAAERAIHLAGWHPAVCVYHCARDFLRSMLRFATKLAPDREKLEIALRAGFRNAEFWLDADRLHDADAILPEPLSPPVGFVLHFPNRGPLSAKQIQNAVKLSRRLGCGAMVIHPPMMRAHGDALRALDPHLRLAVENGGLSLDAFWSWAETNDWLNLDVEHLWKFTLRDAAFEDLLAMLRRFLDRYSAKLAHVHLPGYAPGAPEHQPAYFNERLATAVFDFLAGLDFSGLVVSEGDPQFQTLEHLRRDAELFDRWQAERAARSGRNATTPA